jgi:hypothetical protein
MSKYIPLGVHCAIPRALKEAGLSEYSYPFDWNWCPSKTTYAILKILLVEGVEEAITYMTTGYTYYNWSCINEEFTSTQEKTRYQINSQTGLGITNYIIDEEYIIKLRRRLIRLKTDINSETKIKFLYADTANPFHNYIVDGVEYGTQATPYLEKIYDLVYEYNQNIEVIYFCWPTRLQQSDKITHHEMPHTRMWHVQAEFIKNYLLLYSNKI